MSRPKGIEARVRLLHRTNLVLLGLLLASMVLPMLALRHVDSTQRARYLSYQLATELRQSSDDLTRFARTYVITGDPRYERMYWDVLAIRNGEKPRPAEYWRIYWDFLAAGEASPRPYDVMVSLDHLMKEAGVTPAEFAKLDEARRNSDALVRTETIAMNAVKGLYDDGTGKFTVRKDPDSAMAARIMHDTAYHAEKARIMRPIDEFLGMLDARTRADLSRSLALAWVPPILIALLVIALLIASVASQQTIRRDVIAPVLEISGAVQRVAEADLPALTEQMAALARGALAEVPEITTPPLEVRNDDELGLMARGVNAMLGRLGEARGALAEVTSNLRRLVDEARALTGAAVEGRLSVRGDAGALQGSYREVIQGVNATLDAIVTPLGAVAARMDEIARGTIPAALAVDGRGEFRALQESLNRCVAAINALVVDTATLAEAGAAGRLATRADAARHQGEFRRVIEGVNRTLDAVVTPLGAAARHLDELSRGHLPERIGEEFPGDFQKVKGSLETSIAAVRALLADTTSLADAAVEGRLGTRVEATRHQGDFARIVDGVNRAIDAIVAPVDEAARVLEKIARRDLTARMTGEYRGDHARIKESVNATAASLHEALTQVATAVDQVSSAATQIASSSQAVASGASEQASSLEETTSSLESVATTTKQTAESAQQADHLARSARAAATDGSAAVEQMQGAMSRIKASAEGTSQIIRDINDIAFQTNLLALNAAVEAARAGDAGRGFAVVAEEVRSLALRAKEAASKTEELIRQSVKEAGQGEITAAQVASKLFEIAGGVSKVTDIVAEIATAAREQAAGIQQVTSAVGEMDKVTQQNAASAEESSSAASELSGQAEELAAMVAAFQLAEGASRSNRSRVSQVSLQY